MNGEGGAEGVAVVVGIHGGEEIGGGFVMGTGLPGDPMHAEAVAKASEHAHKKHGTRFGIPPKKWRDQAQWY